MTAMKLVPVEMDVQHVARGEDLIKDGTGDLVNHPLEDGYMVGVAAAPAPDDAAIELGARAHFEWNMPVYEWDELDGVDRRKYIASMRVAIAAMEAG